MRCFLRLAFAATFFARDVRARLNGIVLDSSGAGVPRARIEVTNIETGVVYRAETLDSGDFSVPFLQPGTYSASAEAPGFKKTVRDNIILRAGQAFGITLTLHPGEVTESITVTDPRPLHCTKTMAAGTLRSPRFLSPGTRSGVPAQ